MDGDYFYQVPDYQRPYVWDKDHLGALIDDLVGSYTNDKELYRDYEKWDEKSLQKRYEFLYGIITPILHIEGQEE